MISLELSTIQANSAAQARIDAARADFLARGGRIQVLDKTQTVDAPVSKDRAYVGRLSLREMQLREAQEKSEAEATKVRELAAGMTLRDAAEATGLGRGKLRALADKHGFKFQPGDEQMRARVSAANTDERQDAQNAERLKAFCAAGITRQQAARHMGVTVNVVIRLIEKFKLDYPLNNVWRG